MARRGIFTALVVAFVSTAGAAQAATRVVDDNHQCKKAKYATIAAAVAAAKPGDTISICPGTYVEGPGGAGTNALTIAKSLKIEGAGADVVTIRPRGDRIADDGFDLRNGVGDVVAVTGTPAKPLDVSISGVTIDGAGTFVEAGVVYRDAAGSISHTSVTRVVTSDAADASGKPGGWRSDFPGIGIAYFGAADGPRTLTIDHSRVDSYNRAGVLIEGAAARGVLRGDQVIGRTVCTNYVNDGNCSAPAVVTDGPTFGQDGVRITSGASAQLVDDTVSQNLVHGEGAPTAGTPLNNSNLALGAGVRLVGAGASSIARSNIVDNAYGVLNLQADGTTANTATPVAAENNWWGLWPMSPFNSGPAVSPAINPNQPENPVNGNPAPDTAGGQTSDAVDFFPYRSGTQSDPNTGEWPVVDAPGTVGADAGCGDDVTYDPAIPTFSSVVGDEDGANVPAGVKRHLTADLYKYQEAIVAATAHNPRVKVIEKDLGPTTLDDQHLKIVVVGTPDNIDNLDAGRKDGAFWSGVVSGRVSEATGLAAVGQRPAFAWVTATPHGNEPAAGEATMRLLYEMAARTDCANARRLRNLDVFIDPARNPDGRDQPGEGQRLTPWGFDPNRDFGTRTQAENSRFMPEITQYPGLFFIDAHQQTTGYFFPPNEDPVHHEISHFALDTIQHVIGPTLQQKFNDQTSAYQNYNEYDLFTPEYGDTVPSLIMGGAGMTYEKGETEDYGKQVYDHYLAMDATVNVISDHKPQLLADWTRQWQEAIDQGAACHLQENTLVSPLHDHISQQPTGTVCGYFYKPGLHSGDVAKLVADLESTGVNVYRLDQAVTIDGVHEFGPDGTQTETLPAGTLWIPMDQPMKHWIQAVLGEDPFIPFPYFYDVVTWSYSLMRGMAGDGVLTQQMPSGVAMTEIGDPGFGSTAPASSPVYAFPTDSMAGLGLVFDLLDKGATVFRSAAAFDAAGTHFPTGTALVDGASISAGDLGRLAAARETPVTGLDSYPVARFAIAKPKIGLYAGPTEPVNPDPSGTAPKGYCTSAVALSGGYCEALFTLKEKDRIPASELVALTDPELATLPASGITAVIDPNQTMPDAAALQAFVNQGGRFVATGSGGATSARSAGMTNANTTSISGLTTPGSTFQAAIDATHPAAWGFDEGGWIYRSASGDPVFDPATLKGNGGTIPDATAPISYANPLKSFGYQVNAVGPGKLDGRPAVIDQPFGSGHAVLIGFNPFFRAWHEESERMVLNAALYPTGPAIPAGAPAAKLSLDRALAPVRRSIATDSLPAVGNRPALTVTTDRDVRITVHRYDAAALRGAVSGARLPASVARHVGYESAASSVTLVIAGVRGDDFERRADWVGRVMGGLKRARVKPLVAQV